MKKLILAAAFAAVAVTGQAQIVLTQWNFNSITPDATTGTGTLTPNIGSGTASLFGGATATFATGGTTAVAPASSSDPAGLLTGTGHPDNSAWNSTAYPAQSTGSGTRGVQFLASTLGQPQVSTVTFDTRHSNTASRFVQLQYTVDGTTWTSAGLAGDAIFEADSGGDRWYNGRTVDFSMVSGTDNNPNFGVRITPIFAPGGTTYAPSTTTSTYGGTGTLRYDMVTVNVVPEPATMLALGAGLAAFAAARRRRK